MTYHDFLKYNRRLDNKSRIENLLKYLFHITQNYPNISVNPGFVYYQLIRYGVNVDTDLSKDNKLLDIKDEGLFDMWREYFNNTSQAKVFYPDDDKNQYCYFINWLGSDNGEYDNVCFSLDHDHLYKGMILICDFLTHNHISYKSTVTKNIRTDSIIIRVKKGEKDHKNQLLNFLNSNPYVKFGLNRLNPFMPSDNKICVLDDQMINYQAYLTTIIVEFISSCYKKDDITIHSFKKYIEKKATNQLFAKEIVKHLNKIISDYQLKNNVLLNQAIIATCENKGLDGTYRAILKMVKTNDANNIAKRRDHEAIHVNYQAEIIKRLTKDDIISMLDNMLPQIYSEGELDNLSLEDKVRYYVNAVIQSHNQNLLDAVVRATYLKDGKRQVRKALTNFALKGDTKKFTGKAVDPFIDYRDQLRKNVNKKDVIPLIKTILTHHNIATNNLKANEIIDLYSSSVSDALSRKRIK